MNEAELLFSEVLGCDRANLYLDRDRHLSQEEFVFITSALKRRLKGEPIQYILGKTEFMGLELRVNQDVLIPRPETELLAERALETLKAASGSRVLDLGTGSGCIAVSLAKHLTHLKIDASDISEKALAIARQNAGLHNVSINFIQSDLFTSPKFYAHGYDLIISNPPYIAAGEIKGLQPELQFEPAAALNAGPDGLDFYRRIILDCPRYLNQNGLLMLEIGFNQARALEKIFSDAGKLKIIEVIKDYNHIERIIVARKAEANG